MHVLLPMMLAMRLDAAQSVIIHAKLALSRRVVVCP